MFKLLAAASPKVLAVLGLGGAVVGTKVVSDVKANGAEGETGSFLEWMNRVPGEAGARAGAAIKFEGMYAFVEQIGTMVMGLTNGEYGAGLVNWARKGQGLDPIGATSGTDASADAVAPEESLTQTGNPITAANELNADNLKKGMDGASVDDLVKNVGLVAAGAWDNTIGAVSTLAGGALEYSDEVYGRILKGTFGVDTGFEKRDLMAKFSKFSDDHLEVKPELTTAWDRVAYGAGNVASYFIPGTALAKVGLATSKVAQIGVAAGMGAADAFAPEPTPMGVVN